MSTATDWDKNYKANDLSGHAVSDKSHIIRRRFEIYRRLFKLAPGKKLLEVGCAPGDWLVTFEHEFGMTCTGLDFAPNGCRVAREKLRSYGSTAEVIEADFLTWEPQEERDFDIVFFQGSLEHFPDCAAGVRRALRCVRPGGLVIAQIPIMATWHINGLLNKILDPAAFSDHYTKDCRQMEAAFLNAGLEQIGSEHFGSVQLILGEPADNSRLKKLARRGLAVFDELATRTLDKTDAKFDVPFLNPHGITWGFAPR